LAAKSLICAAKSAEITAHMVAKLRLCHHVWRFPPYRRSGGGVAAYNPPWRLNKPSVWWPPDGGLRRHIPPPATNSGTHTSCGATYCGGAALTPPLGRQSRPSCGNPDPSCRGDLR
jgi:hypothetical protein